MFDIAILIYANHFFILSATSRNAALTLNGTYVTVVSIMRGDQQNRWPILQTYGDGPNGGEKTGMMTGVVRGAGLICLSSGRITIITCHQGDQV